MLVLDTDALTVVQYRSGEKYDALLATLESLGGPVYVTVVSLDEQMHGAFAVINLGPAHVVRGYARLRRLFEAYRDQPMLDFDAPAKAVFDLLVKTKPRRATKDLRIAAIAIARGGTLVTGNVGDFEGLPGLVIERVRT